MTRTRLPRRLPLTPLITAIAALALLTAACSSNSTPTAAGGTPGSGSSSPAASKADSGDAARETAETRLEAIGTQLGTVLADYRSGRTQQAYTLAKAISANLYEGTTEGIVAAIDPAGERQIDPLLAATLPGAIHNGEPASQIATLIHQAQALASSCLTAIHHTE